MNKSLLLSILLLAKVQFLFSEERDSMLFRKNLFKTSLSTFVNVFDQDNMDINLNYERFLLQNQTIVFGVKTYRYNNIDFIDSDGNYSVSRGYNHGVFIGYRYYFRNKRTYAPRGWYISPQVRWGYSDSYDKSEQYHSDGSKDYSFLRNSISNSIGLEGLMGFQTMIKRRMVIDLNLGIGFSRNYRIDESYYAEGISYGGLAKNQIALVGAINLGYAFGK